MLERVIALWRPGGVGSHRGKRECERRVGGDKRDRDLARTAVLDTDDATVAEIDHVRGLAPGGAPIAARRGTALDDRHVWLTGVARELEMKGERRLRIVPAHLHLVTPTRLETVGQRIDGDARRGGTRVTDAAGVTIARRAGEEATASTTRDRGLRVARRIAEAGACERRDDDNVLHDPPPVVAQKNSAWKRGSCLLA